MAWWEEALPEHLKIAGLGAVVLSVTSEKPLGFSEPSLLKLGQLCILPGWNFLSI